MKMNNGSSFESEESFNLFEDNNFLSNLPNVTENDPVINVVQIQTKKNENCILTEKKFYFKKN